MSEIKQVWGIIKDYQCADLEMVQGPALAVWNHQQAKIDELQKRVDEYQKLTTSIRNEFNLWTDGREFADVIEAQIENLEALRGEHE